MLAVDINESMEMMEKELELALVVEWKDNDIWDTLRGQFQHWWWGDYQLLRLEEKKGVLLMTDNRTTDKLLLMEDLVSGVKVSFSSWSGASAALVKPLWWVAILASLFMHGTRM